MDQAIKTPLINFLNENNPWVTLCNEIDWIKLENYFLKYKSRSYSLRLMLGLQILRLSRGICDEDLCREWPENPYYQSFCGEIFFQHSCPIMSSEMRLWRAQLAMNELESLIPARLKNKKSKKATFIIDIDGIVAMLTPENNYKLSRPIVEVITAINRLYEQGHCIVMLTARGTKTGIDWTDTTKKQLNDWGLKYNELYFGKPAGDYYVDDRMLNVEMLCAMASGRSFAPSTKAPSVDLLEVYTTAQEDKFL